MDFKLKKHLSKYLNFHALVNNRRKYYLKTTTEILAIFWLLFPWKLWDEENITWNVFLKPPYLVLSYQLTSAVVAGTEIKRQSSHSSFDKYLLIICCRPGTELRDRVTLAKQIVLALTQTSLVLGL